MKITQMTYHKTLRSFFWKGVALFLFSICAINADAQIYVSDGAFITVSEGHTIHVSEETQGEITNDNEIDVDKEAHIFNPEGLDRDKIVCIEKSKKNTKIAAYSLKSTSQSSAKKQATKEIKQICNVEFNSMNTENSDINRLYGTLDSFALIINFDTSKDTTAFKEDIFSYQFRSYHLLQKIIIKTCKELFSNGSCYTFSVRPPPDSFS